MQSFSLLNIVPRLSILLFFVTCIAVTTAQQCYGLDGKKLDDSYAPCNPNAKFSGCCATKRTVGSPDICLDNGLCMRTNNEMMGTIWQSGCTDATGKDAACPRICPDVNDGFNGLTGISAWNIQTCDFGEFCCRADNDKQSCCNSGSAPQITTTFIGAFQATATPGSTSIASTQVDAPAVSTSTPSDIITTPANTCAKERHQVAVVGGALGGILGAIIVSLVGIIFWIYKKESRQRKLKEHYEEQFSQTNAYRKALASTAGSIRGSIIMDEFRPKSKGLE